jgi:hypothetical protein
MKKLILCLLLIASPLFASDYYVSPNGTNTPGCGAIGSPCYSIQYVINNNALVGNDNVIIRGGTYTLTSPIVINSSDDGSAGNYVTFKNYQNEDVTITTASHINLLEIGGDSNIVQYVKWDGSGSDNNRHITFNGNAASYNGIKVIGGDHITLRYLNVLNTNYQAYQGIKLEGITAEKLGGAGTKDGCDTCLIEYCNVHDTGLIGIKISGYGANNNIVRYNTVYNTGAGGNGISLSGEGFEAHTGESNEIYGNTVYSAGANGIVLNTISNNTIHDNFVHDCIGWGSGNRGIQLSTSCSNNTVYNNFVYGSKYYGVEIAQTSNSNKIYNNVIYGNLIDYSLYSLGEILIQSSSASNLVYNNTIIPLSATANSGIVIASDAGTGNVVENNIVYVGGTGYGLVATASKMSVANYNDFYKSTDTAIYVGGAQTISWLNAQTWGGGHNIRENPAWDSNYRLTASSPQGTGHVRDGALDLSSTFTTDKDGVNRPEGSGWDMGAYEFIEISTLAPPKNLRIPAN